MRTKKLMYRPRIPGMDYALTPYSGCSHGCVYCYARLLRRMRYLDWINPEPIPNAPEIVSRQLLRMRSKPREVFISLGTDPYQPLELESRSTLRIIQVLNQSRIKYRLLTKSNLILRDLDEFSKDSKLGISITTLDPEVKRYWEPYSPSIQDRIHALKIIHESGIECWVQLEPILDESYAQIIQELGDWCDYMVIGKLNYLNPLRKLEWEKVKSHVEQLCAESGVKYSLLW